ncbi:hypothetical protein [Alkalihalobacterium bogoriense]|uniref:hypothetical protein n=1 Tax=Alkalihalobacterium bogoriense TaxID=246272 RepID=UPI00047BCDD3|nr:hypothetical protein [Alkalihalobacterium bogoriense]
MNNIKDLSAKEIRNKYYSLIYTSRRIFHEKQKIDSFLENSLLMCAFILLWLWMGFILLFFIWIAPREGFQLFLIGGIPLAILLLITRYYKKQSLRKRQQINQLRYKIDSFRAKLKKAKKPIPDYPFSDVFDGTYFEHDGTYPFDEYTYYPFED